MKKTYRNSKIVIWDKDRINSELTRSDKNQKDCIIQVEPGCGDNYIIELIDGDAVGTNYDDIVNKKNYDIYIEENVEKYGWERVCDCDDINDAIDRLNEYEFISCNPIRIGVQHIHRS